MKPRDRFRLIKLRFMAVDWHKQSVAERSPERAQALGACAAQLIEFVNEWEREVAE